LRPEGPKFEAEAREHGGVLGEEAAILSPPARGSGERCKLSQRCPGAERRKNLHFGCTKSPKTRLVAANACQSGTLGGGAIALNAPWLRL